MYEAKEPTFFKYLDENGKMKPDAPESAKKEFNDWKKDNPMKVSTENNQITKKK